MAHRFSSRAKDAATARDAAGKLGAGGGIDGRVNAGVAPDRRLADMADEDMNQVADIESKHCKPTVHACRLALAVSARGGAMLTVSRTGQAIVLGIREIPLGFALSLDAE